jgi:hypothetical protein
MKTNRRVLYALLLAAVSGLSACERSDGLGGLTGPEVQQVQQQLSSVDNNGRALGATHKQMQVQVLTRTNTLTGDITYTTTSPVGIQGGSLSFGGHTLVIPKHAVQHWTLFSATLRAGDEIRIDLRAWDMFGAVTNFRRPVELTIDLSDASAEDLDGVSVFYLDPTGSTERMPSVLNLENRSVTGYLNHFSDYIPGTLRNEPPPPVEP